MPTKGNGYDEGDVVAQAVKLFQRLYEDSQDAFFACAAQFNRACELNAKAEAERFRALQEALEANSGCVFHPAVVAFANWALVKNPEDVRRRFAKFVEDLQNAERTSKEQQGSPKGERKLRAV